MRNQYDYGAYPRVRQCPLTKQPGAERSRAFLLVRAACEQLAMLVLGAVIAVLVCVPGVLVCYIAHKSGVF